MSDFSSDAMTDGVDLANAFGAHDSAALARLTASERRDQLRARMVLEAYLSAIWEEPKLRAAREGRDVDAAHPANDPAFSSVSALLDIVQDLVVAVSLAQEAAGDDTDDDETVELLPFDRFEPAD